MVWRHVSRRPPPRRRQHCCAREEREVPGKAVELNDEDKVAAAAHAFAIEGELGGAAPYGSGHINDSYRAIFLRNGSPSSYILQRINRRIFKNPVALMENIERVTSHLAAQVASH